MPNTQDSGGCPAEHQPGRGGEGPGYFEALSDLDPQAVNQALAHFRHWAGHVVGPESSGRLLAALDRQHDELHVLLASCGWTEGVVVFVVGRFFDANVVCGERWGLEPMAKLAECAPWAVAFEMHRHGEHLCSATVELNCDLLNLATHYGGTVTARAFGYDGVAGAELGVWTLPSPREPSAAVTAGARR